METYHNKIEEIGRGWNKTFFKRKAYRAAKYYFQDRFSLTINIIGLLLVVLK